MAVRPRPTKVADELVIKPLDNIPDKQVVGLCGRYGSGKSTSTKILKQLYDVKPNVQQMRVPDATVLDYVVRILFGLLPNTDIVEPIWQLNYVEACKMIKQLLTVHTCKDVAMGRLGQKPRETVPAWWEEKTIVHEAAFAQPLKLICAQLFNVDYTVLGGWTPETRNLRETMKVEYEVGKQIRTYRSVLEYMGTECFRQSFDPEFWVKICKRGMAVSNAKLIICEDMRYENELAAIKAMKGKAFLIFRDEKELIITDEDRKTHTAQWFHLTFAMDLPRIHNGSSIEDLANTWRLLIA